jgi:hypothetical protein
LKQGCVVGDKYIVVCSGEGRVGQARRKARRALCERASGGKLEGKCSCCKRAEYGVVVKGAFACAARDVVAHLAGVLTQNGKNSPLTFTMVHNDFQVLGGADFEVQLREAMAALHLPHQPPVQPLAWDGNHCAAWLQARRWREELLRGDSNDCATLLDHLQAERAAGQQPRVLAHGGCYNSREIFADVMNAAGFTSVTVAEVPPLDVSQFDVAVELRYFDLRLKELKYDRAYAYLIHSLSSLDYSPTTGAAADMQWPEEPQLSALCTALAEQVLFIKGDCRTRMKAVDVRRILSTSRSRGSLPLEPRAFGAAMCTVSSTHFKPRQAQGNVLTYLIRPRLQVSTTSVVEAGLCSLRTAAAALVASRKRAAEGGGPAAAAKRVHFSAAGRL